MEADSPNWRAGGRPASDAEAAALEAVRKLLPDVGCIAWTNQYFIDGQGRGNEVDVIILSRLGLFVVELKGWHGTIGGNQFRWTRQSGRFGRTEVPNPLKLTDDKAKRLRSLLDKAKSRAKLPRLHLPRVVPLVVLHGQDSKIELPADAATGVYALDGYRVAGLPRFGELLRGRLRETEPIDAETFAAVARLFDRMGMQAKPKARMIGQYRIDDADPIAEGPGWVDYEVVHPGIPNHRRRVRLFTLPPKASAAERARITRNARREYLLTNDLAHRGVASATEFLDEAPAVVFMPDPDALPLDRWLSAHAKDLDLASRLRLLGDVAEVVQYAHKRGRHHRALAPSAVYVRDTPEGPTVTVRDWQTGSEDVDQNNSPDTALFGETQVRTLADQDLWVYLAPEAHKVAYLDGTAMDVYGLGVLAYLLVTGKPPAPSLSELETRLSQGGLNASVEVDALPEDLLALIDMATEPVVSDRLGNVDEFLDELASATRALAEEQDEPNDVTDPLEAQPGDELEDTWLVERRLGSGSTGRALLVTSGEKGARPYVLKVALRDDTDYRLLDEAEVLAALDHPLIVKGINGPFTLGGRTCLLMEYAGDPTLGRMLREDGRLPYERLETFGADLLSIGRALATAGINHRDIKPDNLAIRPDTSGSKRPRLRIFDFSASRMPVSDVRSGTRPYLDPFLGAIRGRPTYDSAAERFAIAVTLFEMATGHQPVWGDGTTPPENLQDVEVTVTTEMFEGPVPTRVAEFFARALAREAAARFDDIEAMSSAWVELYAEPTSTTTITGTLVSEDDRDTAAARVVDSTPLAESGLSPQALSAVRRLGAETVADVLRLDPIGLNKTVGIGQVTRREIQRRRKQWLALLRDQTWVAEVPAAGRSVEDLRATLVPRPNGTNRAAVSLAKALVAADSWPTLRELAAHAEVHPADLPVAMEQLRRFWRKNARLSDAAEEVRFGLAGAHKVAAVDELAALLVARHGSQLLAESDRLAAAVPVIRALTEAQDPAREDVPLMALNRVEGSSVILLAAVGDAEAMVAEVLMAEVRALAVVADEAVAGGSGLVSAPDAEALVAQASAQFAIPAARLVRLAATCSRHADASTRGELYRVGLPATVTLPRVLHGAGTSVLAEKTLRERVTRRYPRAAALPPRPDLDALVSEAMPGLVWDGSNYSRTVSSSLLISATRTTSLLGDRPGANVAAATARLRTSLADRRGLVLAADPRRLDDAAAWLSESFDVQVVDVAGELIRAAKASAGRLKGGWPFLVKVDATGTGPTKSRLDRYMAAALDTFWDATLTAEDPLLLTGTAILARYGLAARLAPLTNLAVPQPAARWILVPHRASNAVPTLDGTPLPIGPGGWVEVPIAAPMHVA